jgi:opacity protein-like surface antigen
MKKAALTIGLFVGMLWPLQVYAGGLFNEGVTEWSFSVGYGKNFNGVRHPNVSEDIKFVPLIVSWNKVFKKFTSDASLEYGVEGIISYARQESEDAYLAGVTPLLIYNFKKYGRLTPYVDAGVGFVVTNLSPKGFGGDWGFTPQVGIGFRYAVKDGQFIRFSYRYHHISNAGFKADNKSIDSNFFFVGYSFLR